jgi:hypothetical protein
MPLNNNDYYSHVQVEAKIRGISLLCQVEGILDTFLEFCIILSNDESLSLWGQIGLLLLLRVSIFIFTLHGLMSCLYVISFHSD